MEPYTYEAKKYEKGYVMVRDYNLNQCFKSGKDLRIIRKYRGKYVDMVVPHGELKKRALLLDKRVWPSQYDGHKPYRNYHFKWEEDRNAVKVEDRQERLPL